MIFKSDEAGLSDLLNYAHLIDDGVILQKDGGFLVSYKFQGPDLYSASGGELDTLTLNFNRMVNMLEDGWMLHVDELRIPSVTYPAQGFFPDPVSSLIDEERRVLYQSKGIHYENIQVLTFVWKFPLPLVKTTKHWFVEGLPADHDSENLTKRLQEFYETVDRAIGTLSQSFVLEKLTSKDLFSYLNTCITGELLPVALPPDGCFIDVVLGRRNLVGGYVPKIGNKFIYVLSIVGYLNSETIPGLLDEMGTYPLVYRWSNRFIPLSEKTAEREIKRYQKHWNNKVKGFSGILREVFLGRATNKIDLDALEMREETSDALTLNSNQTTRFGYWTSEIVLIHEELSLLNESAKDLTRYLEQNGFTTIQEDVNALDAWLGTIPGHGSSNVRRLFMSGINLSHVLPLHTVWTGASITSSHSLLPHEAPPVFYAATIGKTPFRFHLDVSDVGHQVVLGPTGSGKSTYLGFLISQFLRYEGAQIFVFDKDHSHRALTEALGGLHYDLGGDMSLSFCPLADLSTESKRVRASQFIEELVSLQNVMINPDIRAAIHKAIEALSESGDPTHRNLTVLQGMVQDYEVRKALQYYTIEGQIKVLDATQDDLKTGYLQTFEMHWLLSQKEAVYLPILLYLFQQIEIRLEEACGRRPTLIILEEAWLYISHEVFAKKLKDWLKTLRKQNARVVFATQSLADLYDPVSQSLTKTTAAIMESCPTKVYLPNPSMESEIKTLYQKMGLTERQIDIIQKIGVPKRHYYVVTQLGNRLIDLGLTDPQSLALSFVGLSKEKSQKLLACKEMHGNDWVYHWLIKEGFVEWAKFLESFNHREKEAIQ